MSSLPPLSDVERDTVSRTLLDYGMVRSYVLIPHENGRGVHLIVLVSAQTDDTYIRRLRKRLNRMMANTFPVSWLLRLSIKRDRRYKNVF